MKLLFLFFILFSFLFSNEKVSLQLKWKHQFQFAGFYVAKELGYYNNLGIDIEFKELNKDTKILEDVLSKKTTFGINDSYLVYEKMLNKDIKLLFATYQLSPLVFLSLKNRNIIEPKDLDGKVIEYTKSNKDSVSLNILLKSQNIDFIKKFPTFNVNDLIDGKTDVISAYMSNEAYKIKKLGYEYNIINPSDWGYKFYSDILFTSNDFLRENEELVHNFYNASIKGWLYAFTHIEEVVKLIYNKYNTQNKSLDELRYEAHFLKDYIGDLKEFGKIEKSKIDNISTAYSIIDPIQYKQDIFDDFIYEYNSSNSKKAFLTTKEEIYLKENRFNIYFNNWKPFTFIDKIDNKLKGISYDYWEYIEKTINIKTDASFIEKWNDILDLARNDENSILLSTSISEDKKEYGLFTKPYVSYPISIVTKNDKNYVIDLKSLSGKKIAVGKSFSAYKLLSEYYPNIEYILVNNTQDALDMVSKNEVYGAADILPVIINYMNSNGYSDLKISANTKETLDLRIMVNKYNPELVNILNKVIDNIDEDKKQLIFNKWVNTKLIEKFDYSFFYKVMFLVFILICFIVYYIYINYKLKKQNKQIHKLLLQKEKSQKKLIEQSKFAALGEMLDNIAHQWKQPLSVISVSASGLKLKNEMSNLTKDEIEEYLSKITINTAYLSDTIETFRNFLHEDKVLENVNINRLVEKSIELAKLNIDSKNIKFEFYLMDEEIFVNVIKNEFIQIIMNLVVNAKEQFEIKAIETPIIRVKTISQKDSVYITVEDNAGGIELKYIDKIFDAYFTTKHQSFGTGIGLYMSRRIIQESFNGKIDVVNIKDGAKFIIELKKT